MLSKWEMVALTACGCVLAASPFGIVRDAHAGELSVAVAVSTNLPEETLAGLARQAQKLNARLLVRGLPLTQEEEKVLLSRGHFGESGAVQKENRALLKEGFARLASYARRGILLAVDPVFFRDRDIASAPTVVFALNGKEVRLTGFTDIRAAARYGAKKIEDTEMKRALLKFTGEVP